MYLKWNSFKTYCIEKNIQLLKDDFKFIERELVKIPPRLYRSVLSDFTKEWLKVLAEETNASQAQNLARRTSNKWLREECERLKAQ